MSANIFLKCLLPYEDKNSNFSIYVPGLRFNVTQREKQELNAITLSGLLLLTC